MKNSWLAVDKDGLARLVEKRGKAFAIFELVQNAWDTQTKSVDIYLSKIAGKPLATLEVRDDDPDGFMDLGHAYTMFADSFKKNDPEKRGRFNLGEKLVLALCTEATISSTKGSVIFHADGHREETPKGRTTSGSVFKATIRMTTDEFSEVEREVRRLLPPAGIQTIFNSAVLPVRKPVAETMAILPTVKSDEEGNLTRTMRKAVVRIYATDGEEGCIYEMGIPVVTTGDRFHVDVQQKVPVNLDRDNVPPAYLRTLRALTLNATHHLLDKDAASENWVTDAISHKDVEGAAVEKVLTDRFSERRAIFDPKDQEANNRLVSQGYTIIHGGTLNGDAWANVKRFEAAKPSGVLSPTPKPYSQDPNAKPVDLVPYDKWTDGMKEVVALTKRLGKELLNVEVQVTIVNTSNGFAACYGNGALDFNLRRLGHDWFTNWRGQLNRVLDLIIHEFGHHYAANHLSEQYHDALTDLGARLAVLALRKPGVFG